MTAEDKGAVRSALYVAPNGSDEAGDGSEINPFRTPEKARDTIRGWDGLPDGGVTVYLRGGEYNLKETFTLTPEDSGEEGRPVVWTSYPGEEVSIVSKEPITGWRRLTDAEKADSLFGMSAEAKEAVWVAEIPAGWRFHDLYAGGERLPVSRMTESDDWESGWPRARAGRDDFSPDGLRAKFDPGVLDGLDGWEDAEVKLLTAIWWNVNAALSGIDSARNTALIRSALTVFYSDLTVMGGQYNLMNTPKYLTRGEWCVDSVRGRVCLWPKDGGDPNLADIFAPRLRELIRFQGDEEEDGWARQVRFVTLRGLRFLYSDRVPETELDPEWLTRNGESPDGMIYMQGVDSCSVEDCVLGFSGGQGIVLDHYAQNCSVTGCEIGQASSGGVYITGYGPGTADLNRHNRVARNHIHHVGRDYMHSCAVQFFASGDNTVEYNYFHDLPYAAVSVIGMAWQHMRGGEDSIDTQNTFGGKHTMYNPRWDEIDQSSIRGYLDALPYQHSGGSVIRYNICDHYMQTLRDGGALYAWCSGRDKKWLRNCGYRAFTDDWAVRGIHMDDWEGFNTLAGNLFHASGATDNSHTNGTPGGRGDGGRDDLDIRDDTLGDNVWRENVITADSLPEGYLALRREIREGAGGWIGVLPGADVLIPDELLSRAVLFLDADSGCSGIRSAQDAPCIAEHGKYRALRFDGGERLEADGWKGLPEAFTVAAVCLAEDMPEDGALFSADGLTVGVFGDVIRLRTEDTDAEGPCGNPEKGFASAVIRKKGTMAELFSDGVPVGRGPAAEGSGVPGKGVFRIGAGFRGEIACLAAFDSALTDGELALLEELFKSRYSPAGDPL